MRIDTIPQTDDHIEIIERDLAFNLTFTRDLNLCKNAQVESGFNSPSLYILLHAFGWWNGHANMPLDVRPVALICRTGRVETAPPPDRQ